METSRSPSLFSRLRKVVLGRARNPFDQNVFHHLSLIAFFAWVGLGADGLSSSAYGPEEAFKAMGAYPHLSLFVALAAAATVFIISTSYSQIIELFPTGGGGYLVASKLLSPELGMVSGCALVLDYILTISISIASGADYLFSFLPLETTWHGMTLHPHGFKLPVALAALLLLTLMNLRGVKESVVPLVPIFLTFLLTHAAVIVTAIFIKLTTFPQVLASVQQEVQSARGEANLGLLGLLILMLRAYTMGAGTYTGIEAVSNGLPILREPRVVTGKKTMRYMAFSLAFTVLGLMIAYLLYEVKPQEGMTLNAVLFNRFTEAWGAPGSTGHWLGRAFVGTALFSSAAILFVAAQAGFLDGPRVLSNMALDRWVPHRFAMLSDRLVTENGIVVMGVAALVTLLITGGSVDLLVVLYSINVFITFVLSQAGMVRHWWQVRHTPERSPRKLCINGVGLVICSGILLATVVLKFSQGGWLTLLLTLAMIVAVLLIRRHYDQTHKLLGRLNSLVRAAEATATRPVTGVSFPAPGEGLPASAMVAPPPPPPPAFDPQAKTAVLIVNGFNGLGLHTLFSIVRLFGGVFRNFIVLHVGLIDQGNFKGVSELAGLREHSRHEVDRYVHYLQREGYFAQGFWSVGLDVVSEVGKLAEPILKDYPGAVFFGGQLVFPRETILTRWLHNNTVFSLQRRFYNQGVPVVILPVRV